MSFVVKGWCPGALRPMESGDGLVVRIRPHLSRLSPTEAASIAEAAARFGNGLIDLSGRANVQIRGVSETSHLPLLDALASLGLIDNDVATETRRNIVVAPLWQVGDETFTIATALEALVPDLPDLPGKFGFAVDTGPSRVLSDVPADIRIERAENGAVIVRADGAALGIPAGAADADGVVQALAEWFATSGGIKAGRGRMAAHLSGGAIPPERLRGTVAPCQPARRPLPGRNSLGTFAAFAFGQTDARTLSRLAEKGRDIRITPWRMVLIEGDADLSGIPGLILDPADPLRRVVACTGAPGCIQAFQPTRDLAARLAPGVPEGSLLHVSGCAKGCAHPAPAAVTLVGTSGGFDLVRDGRSQDTPRTRGLGPDALFPLIGPA
jgi:precorrin-3B synthase